MLTERRTGEPCDEEHLVLGRSLTDPSFRDLFLHDPERAAAMLQIVLSPESVERVRRRLCSIREMSTLERGHFSSKMNSRERWKEM